MNDIRKYVDLIESEIRDANQSDDFDLEKEIMTRRTTVPHPVVDDHGIGSMPMNTNIDYLGVRVKMKPMTFLQLAANIDFDLDSHKIQSMKRALRTGTSFAPPLLELTFDRDQGIYRVIHHEGRHRMQVLLMLSAWRELPIEVHLVIRGMRHDDIDQGVRASISRGIGQEEYPHLPHPRNRWRNYQKYT